MDAATANVNSGVTGVGKSGQEAANQSRIRRGARINARSMPHCPHCGAVGFQLDHSRYLKVTQVAAGLRSGIAEGECPPGQKVASGQEISPPLALEEIDNFLMALDMLADQGVIRRYVPPGFAEWGTKYFMP